MERHWKRIWLSLMAIAVLLSGMKASAEVVLTGTYDSSSSYYTSGRLEFGEMAGYSLQNATIMLKDNFGTRGQGSLQDGLKVSLDKGTNTFLKSTTFGARSGSATDGVGGSVTVNLNGGVNTFVTRAMFGGEGGHGTDLTKGASTVGRATVTFGDSVTTFERNRDSSSSYYGVYFSAVGQSDFTRVFYYDTDKLTTKKEYSVACLTEGTTVNFAGGGQSTFNTLTYFGGGYDLTTYCQVHTSSDDQDIVYGGTNNITFGDSAVANFYGRTFFGAAESVNNITFQGDSSTTFGGSDVFWSAESQYSTYKGYVLKDYSEWMAIADNDIFTGNVVNSYKGQDLPYVFLGGSNLTQEDLDTFNFDPDMRGNSPNGGAYRDYAALPNAGQSAQATIKIGGNAEVAFRTTAFFGGADERNLAGDQYVYSNATDNKVARFLYGDVTNWASQGTDYRGESAIRTDTGIGNLTLEGNGTLVLGVANQNKVLGWDWDVTSTSPQAHSYIRKRYEQVRLIGATSEFKATSGAIQFDITKHNQTQLDEGGYSHTYLVDSLVAGQDYDEINSNGLAIINQTTTAKTLQLGSATLLDAGMFVFSKISTSANTDYQITGIWKLIGMNPEEYYTTTVFVTTGQDANGENGYAEHLAYDNPTTGKTDELELNLTAQSVVGGANPLDAQDTGNKLTVDKTTYEHLLYNLYVEDVVDESSALGSAVTTRRARLHITTKGLEETLEGNLKNNVDTIEDILHNGEEGDPIYDAVTDILDSETMEEASDSFDDLIGSSYGNEATAQIRRLTTTNSLLANQLNAVDPSRQSVREPQCDPGCTPDGGPSCGSGKGNGKCQCKPNLWASFFGDSEETKANNFFSGYDTESYSGMIGADWACDDGVLMGSFFSYGQSSLFHDSNIGYSSIQSKDYNLGAYAKWLSLVGGGYTMAIGTVGLSGYDGERSIYGNRFTSNYHGVLPSFYLEKGWVFYADRKFSFNPYAAAQLAYYRTEAFSEESDPSNWIPQYGLDVSTIEMTSLRTFVGVRLAYDMWSTGKCHGTLRMNVSWIHELMDETPVFSSSPQYNSGYSPAPWHTVSGDQVGQDWVNLGVGTDFTLTERLALIADYGCFFNEYTTVHTGMATLRFSF